MKKGFLKDFSLQFRELLETLGFKFYEVKPPPETGQTVYPRGAQNEKPIKGNKQKVERHEQHK